MPGHYSYRTGVHVGTFWRKSGGVNYGQAKQTYARGAGTGLIEAISEGNYYAVACNYAGIHYSTFRRWMVQGSLNLPRF